MTKKNPNGQGRYRSKTVAFHVTPGEDALIKSAVRMTGLTKQEYIIRRLANMTVFVQGNPRVFRGLRKEMQAILEELRRLDAREQLPQNLITRLDLLARIMDGMRFESNWSAGKEEMNGRQ